MGHSEVVTVLKTQPWMH